MVESHKKSGSQAKLGGRFWTPLDVCVHHTCLLRYASTTSELLGG
jgi:hypothetical protein